MRHALRLATACAIAPLMLLFLAVSCRERKAYLGIDDSAIELIDSVCDFGVCHGDSIVRVCSFRLRNVGTEPLVINKVAATCGCTVADYDKEPVPPGGVTSIKVRYHGSASTHGAFVKVLTVYSNARNGLARLTVCGRKEP